MIIVIILVGVTFIARGVGKWRGGSLDSWPAATRIGLAVMFCFTGVAHFNSMRHELAKMVPPWVPEPNLVIVLTGVCEILGAIGLLVPSTRKAAAWALVVFLVAVFPANATAAKEGMMILGQPATPLVPRLLIQLAFIGLTWWAGVKRGNK